VLAMARHQLGHKEQAKAALENLRVTMAKPEWAKNTDCQQLLQEAGALFARDGRPATNK